MCFYTLSLCLPMNCDLQTLGQMQNKHKLAIWRAIAQWSSCFKCFELDIQTLFCPQVPKQKPYTHMIPSFYKLSRHPSFYRFFQNGDSLGKSSSLCPNHKGTGTLFLFCVASHWVAYSYAGIPEPEIPKYTSVLTSPQQSCRHRITDLAENSGSNQC